MDSDRNYTVLTIFDAFWTYAAEVTTDKNGGKHCMLDKSSYLHAGADLPHHTRGAISALDNVWLLLFSKQYHPERDRKLTKKVSNGLTLTLCNRSVYYILSL